MKVLIVEDDFISRKILKEILTPYGECDIAIDGREAITAFRMAYEEGACYDLICMDVIMPNMDGQQALKVIRTFEKQSGVCETDEVKIFMITALGDPKTVVEALYRGGANSYLVKPISKQKLLHELRNFGLIQ